MKSGSVSAKGGRNAAQFGADRAGLHIIKNSLNSASFGGNCEAKEYRERIENKAACAYAEQMFESRHSGNCPAFPARHFNG